VIDTSDLPLNVSREIVQKNKAIETIRAASVKKILGLIESLVGGEDYAKFWRAFGRVLKEGVIEDFANRDRIAKLLRFSSTRDDAEEPAVGLDEYVSRMQEGQEAIYYITSDSFATARNSPHLEYFRDRGIEVLLLHDPIDEWLVTHLTEFEGKPLKSIVHAELDDVAAREEAQEDETAAADQSGLLERIRKALGDRVEDVRESRRLTASPACLVSSGEQMSANLERILKAAGQEVPDSKRILELNLGHPMVHMLAEVEDDGELEKFATLLYEQSVLAEGGRLDDPAGFVRRMNEVVLSLAEPRD
jgi:molecular chaperone HtpG